MTIDSLAADMMESAAVARIEAGSSCAGSEVAAHSLAPVEVSAVGLALVACLYADDVAKVVS